MQVFTLEIFVNTHSKAGALRQDWPRVPLPKTAKILKAGADLGRQIAALLDPETPVEDVTTLKVRPDLKGLGELAVNEGSADTPVVFHNVALCCIHLQSLAAQGFGDGCALRPIASSGAELHVFRP
ncbi:MAG: hypothetical protein ACOYOF_16905 [Verrucomicrobiaceae bacterium]